MTKRLNYIRPGITVVTLDMEGDVCVVIGSGGQSGSEALGKENNKGWEDDDTEASNTNIWENN